MAKVGAPAKYEDPELMKSRIEEYFDNPPVRIRYTKDGTPYEAPFLSITGLVLHLGFCDRASFYDYEKKSEFSHILKTARTFIEQEYEAMLQCGNTTGAIFALKQFGWTDRQEIDNKSSDGSMTPKFSSLYGTKPVGKSES